METSPKNSPIRPSKKKNVEKAIMVVNKAEADELMTKYLKGNKVNVYYNPTNHAEAALITAKGVPLLAYFMVIMFVVSIIGAIIFVLKSNILSD